LAGEQLWIDGLPNLGARLGEAVEEAARAQAFRPANGQILWLLDAEAASLLPLPEAQAGTGEAPGPLPDISV